MPNEPDIFKRLLPIGPNLFMFLKSLIERLLRVKHLGYKFIREKALNLKTSMQLKAY